MVSILRERAVCCDLLVSWFQSSSSSSSAFRVRKGPMSGEWKGQRILDAAARCLSE